MRAAECFITNRFQVWVADPLVSSQRAERASDLSHTPLGSQPATTDKFSEGPAEPSRVCISTKSQHTAKNMVAQGPLLLRVRWSF